LKGKKFVSVKNTWKKNSKKPEISTLQNRTGFEKPVLQIKPSANNQNMVNYGGENFNIGFTDICNRHTGN
jgi:Tfp pilus assembly protein PilX